MQLAIQETQYTPSVSILAESRRIVISGQSRLEDPTAFYEKLIDVLEQNMIKFKSRLFIDFKLSYVNSSSSKWIFHILKGIQKKYHGHKLITINWYYDGDDDCIIEAGEVFQSLLEMPFNIIETR
jgi:hypothetical protein